MNMNRDIPAKKIALMAGVLIVLALIAGYIFGPKLAPNILFEDTIQAGPTQATNRYETREVNPPPPNR